LTILPRNSRVSPRFTRRWGTRSRAYRGGLLPGRAASLARGIIPCSASSSWPSWASSLLMCCCSAISSRSSGFVPMMAKVSTIQQRTNTTPSTTPRMMRIPNPSPFAVGCGRWLGHGRYMSDQREPIARCACRTPMVASRSTAYRWGLPQCDAASQSLESNVG
jgi:hypothetical protein